jgi:outer membrane protein assembly factor BamB
LKWYFATGDNVHSSPTIGSDGTIYFGSWDNKLYAINPDGTQKWNFTTGGYVSSSPAIGSDGTIYFGSSDNKLYAINPDGTEKWSFATGDVIQSSPAIGHDGTIFIGSNDRKVHAIYPNGTQKWNFTTGLYVLSSPSIASDGTVYVGSYDGKLYAINPDGTQKWNFTTSGFVHSSPAIGFDGTIYVGTVSSFSTLPNFYAIYPDGSLKWEIYLPTRIFSSPAIGLDGTLYVGTGWYSSSPDLGFYAVNPNGTVMWKFDAGDDFFSSPSIGSDGTIYIGSRDHRLYAINQDGSQKWNFTAMDSIDSSPTIDSDGTIYVGSSDRNLYAIGTPAQGQPLIADAGPDQVVDEGQTVHFHGEATGGSGGSYEWSLKANITTRRMSLGVASVGGLVYAIGGNLAGEGSPGYPSGIVEVYDPITDTWASRSDMNYGGAGLAVSAVGGKIYALGLMSGPFTQWNEVYDPITDTWTLISPMPTVRSYVASAVVDDKIYVVGGRSTMNPNASFNEEYDPATSIWTEKAPIPTKRYALAATTLNGKVYAIGGVDSITHWRTDLVEVYDPSTDSWSTAAPLPFTSIGNAAVAYNGKIYVASGNQAFDCVTDSYFAVYDPGTDIWTNLSSLIIPRRHFSMAEVNGNLYAIGGTHGWMCGNVAPIEEYAPSAVLDFTWDMNHLIDSDGDGNSTNDIDATGQNPSHIYGDNGDYVVTLTVTDNAGSTAHDTVNVTVLNLDPAVSVEVDANLATKGNVTLRLAGEKYHDATMYLYEDGVEVGNVTVFRVPGNPDDQSGTIRAVEFNLSRVYTANVLYTPDDDPINGQPNGATPAWIILSLEDCDETRIHHTFNVKHPETWDWSVELNPYLCRVVEINATAIDPGSDDLIFNWSFGASNKYYNDGAGPDPYPSPGGIFPFEATDKVRFDYTGSIVIKVVVWDDDGGSQTIELALN